jgi:hypothetical protein
VVVNLTESTINRLIVCEGKKKRSWTEANKTANQIGHREGKKGRVSIYRCFFCRYWHVGGDMRPKNKKYHHDKNPAPWRYEYS